MTPKPHAHTPQPLPAASQREKSHLGRGALRRCAFKMDSHNNTKVRRILPLKTWKHGLSGCQAQAQLEIGAQLAHCTAEFNLSLKEDHYSVLLLSAIVLVLLT
jgi:hypothetical protein